jgi:hypothetical protein
MSQSPVVQHIKQAAAHEDSAGRHVEKYEQQMKAAGASMYAAFVLAAKAAPDYQGRKIDDKAIARIYQSKAPRPWWDAALIAAGVAAGKAADRDRAVRLIQWHTDPDAAQARHAQRQLQQAAAQRKLRAKRATEARGMTSSRKAAAVPTTAQMRAVHDAGQTSLHAGRELRLVDSSRRGEDNAAKATTLEELLAEVNRIQSAVKKVKAEDRTAVFEILRVTARELERHA